jgi:hypothetical protein
MIDMRELYRGHIVIGLREKASNGDSTCSQLAEDAADYIELLEYHLRCDRTWQHRAAKLEAEVGRLLKSRNKWGKLYNQTLEKLRLSVMSDSEYVKVIDEKCAEQANRIEKLEAALEKIAQHDMQAIAMDALRPGERIRKALDAE